MMTHNLIFECFELHLRPQARNVVEWFPNGKNSIRVRLTNGQDYIFTYINESEWSFETVDRYISTHMKGELPMKC